MRFTDRKGIKIYCCVSFSPCKVWIKCHTLACELLNELVCSLWCEPCKYPSWLWNGGLLSPGGWRLEAGGWGGAHKNWGRHWSAAAPTIRPPARDRSTERLYWLAACGWCSTPEVAGCDRWESSPMAQVSGDFRRGNDWQAPPSPSKNEMIDMRCQTQSSRGQI